MQLLGDGGDGISLHNEDQYYLGTLLGNTASIDLHQNNEEPTSWYEFLLACLNHAQDTAEQTEDEGSYDKNENSPIDSTEEEQCIEENLEDEEKDDDGDEAPSQTEEEDCLEDTLEVVANTQESDDTLSQDVDILDSLLEWISQLFSKFDQLLKDYDPIPPFKLPVAEARMARIPSYTPPIARGTNAARAATQSARPANDNAPRAANNNGRGMSRPPLFNNNGKPNGGFKVKTPSYGSPGSSTNHNAFRPNTYDSYSSSGNSHSFNSFPSSASKYRYSTSSYNSYHSAGSSTFGSSSSSSNSFGSSTFSSTYPSNSGNPFKLQVENPIHSSSYSSFTNPSPINTPSVPPLTTPPHSFSFMDEPRIFIHPLPPATPKEEKPKVDHYIEYDFSAAEERKQKNAYLLYATLDIEDVLKQIYETLIYYDIPIEVNYLKLFLQADLSVIESALENGFFIDMMIRRGQEQQEYQDNVNQAFDFYHAKIKTSLLHESEDRDPKVSKENEEYNSDPHIADIEELSLDIDMMARKAHKHASYQKEQEVKPKLRPLFAGGSGGNNGTDTGNGENVGDTYKKYEEYKTESGRYDCPKQISPVWNSAQNSKGEYKTNGLKGRKKETYRWDELHRDIEVYNHLGIYMGSKDPVTGIIYRK